MSTVHKEHIETVSVSFYVLKHPEMKEEVATTTPPLPLPTSRNSLFGDNQSRTVTDKNATLKLMSYIGYLPPYNNIKVQSKLIKY
jgi:hypothetical protein